MTTHDGTAWSPVLDSIDRRSGRPLPQPERCADEVPGHKMATGWNGNQPNPDALTSQTTKPSRLASPAGSIFFRNPDAHATPGRCLRCPTAT